MASDKCNLSSLQIQYHERWCIGLIVPSLQENNLLRHLATCLYKKKEFGSRKIPVGHVAALLTVAVKGKLY